MYNNKNMCEGFSFQLARKNMKIVKMLSDCLNSLQRGISIFEWQKLILEMIFTKFNSKENSTCHEKCHNLFCSFQVLFSPDSQRRKGDRKKNLFLNWMNLHSQVAGLGQSPLNLLDV